MNSIIVEHLSDQYVKNIQLLWNYPLVKIGYTSDDNYSENFNNISENNQKDWIILYNNKFYFVSSLINDVDSVEFFATKENRIITLISDLDSNLIKLRLDPPFSKMLNMKFITWENGFITSELGFSNCKARIGWNAEKQVNSITHYKNNLPNGLVIHYDHNPYAEVYKNIKKIQINDINFIVVYYIGKGYEKIDFQIKNMEEFINLLLEYRKSPSDNNYVKMLTNCIILT